MLPKCLILLISFSMSLQRTTIIRSYFFPEKEKQKKGAGNYE